MSAQSPRGKTGGENGGNPVCPRGENEENEGKEMCYSYFRAISLIIIIIIIIFLVIFSPHSRLPEEEVVRG